VTSLVIRLCLLMVAAFGSRPCGVIGAEPPRAPLLVALRDRAILDANAGSHDPSVPSVRFLVRVASAIRVPSLANGTAAAPPAEAVVWPDGIATQRLRVSVVARRTPCAGCGDGSPYDATAPPARA